MILQTSLQSYDFVYVLLEKDKHEKKIIIIVNPMYTCLISMEISTQ